MEEQETWNEGSHTNVTDEENTPMELPAFENDKVSPLQLMNELKIHS